MPLLTNRPNLLFENIEPSADASFLHATKVNSEHYGLGFSARIRKWQADKNSVRQSRFHFKNYFQSPIIPLAPDLKRFQNINWEQVVLKRESQRNFGPTPIHFAELSNLLLLSCGLKDRSKDQEQWIHATPPDEKGFSDMEKFCGASRALPSGGGLYPLEIYVLARHVDGLAPGLYHMSPLFGSLSQLTRHEQPYDLSLILSQTSLFGDSAAVIFTTAIFERSRVKYGPRSLRFILLEAGGIGTQMSLLATAMNVGFCFDGGGFEDKIEHFLSIDGYREALVSLIHLGHSTDGPNRI